MQVGDLDVHVRISEQRRTVRLTVERDAGVTALVPPRLGRDELVALIKAKRRWLYGKLAERQEVGERRPPREYVSGEGFPYLGRGYRLRIVDDAPAQVRLILARTPP
jgi:predicted metal-dependent hydrolase